MIGVKQEPWLVQGRLVGESAQRSALRVPAHWLCYLAPELLRGIALPPRLPSSIPVRPVLPCRSWVGVGGETLWQVPELEFSAASDVFAYGSLWYELVSGAFPWAGVHPQALLWQAASGLKPPLHQLPALKELRDLILQAWALDPDARPGFSHLLHILDRSALSSPPPSPSANRTPLFRLPRKMRQGLSRSPSHPISLSRSAESMF